MDNLRPLDLNLLLTLDVLLAEQHVTRAAQRLHLTQPSVSIQLAKLREVFQDPLLLPAPRGMRTTARAEALREPLRHALQALEQAVAPQQAFEPAKASRTFCIAASDYSEHTVILPALPGLRVSAPGTRLSLVQKHPASLARQAEQGEIDLALHTHDELAQSLRHRVLFDERYVLAGRLDHPGLRRRPGLKRFCQFEHAVVSPAGGGFVGITDAVLAESGLSRRVVLSVPHFTFLCAALASTDLVALLPARLVRAMPGLRIVEAPLPIPGFQLCMAWHERVHRDPAHRWLRECLASSA